MQLMYMYVSLDSMLCNYTNCGEILICGSSNYRVSGVFLHDGGPN